MPVDGATVGLAGAARLIRVDRVTQTVRQGVVVKSTTDTAYFVTSLRAEEADPPTLLDLLRGYWVIETGQHYRRDHTQREDHCLVQHNAKARTLSLLRSLSIFLYERQRHQRGGKAFLPDWQRKNLRQPAALITCLMGYMSAYH